MAEPLCVLVVVLDVVLVVLDVVLVVGGGFGLLWPGCAVVGRPAGVCTGTVLVT